MVRFTLVNFIVASVAVAAWQFGMLDWLGALPRTTWLSIWFLVIVWGGGVLFAAAGRWETTAFIGNSLPILGLLATGISIQIAAASLHAITPDAALAVFQGIIRAMPPTFVGLFGFVAIRELCYWCAGDAL